MDWIDYGYTRLIGLVILLVMFGVYLCVRQTKWYQKLFDRSAGQEKVYGSDAEDSLQQGGEEHS